MSFVPTSGVATFRAADPPRESVVEFSDDRRTVALPMRAALPVLARVRGRDDVHPTVGLLSGAVLLGMRLVADGKFRPDDGAWRIAPLDAHDTERVELLAASREVEVDLVRQVLDAIADTVPRSAPLSTRRRTPPAPARPDGRTASAPGPDFAARLQARIARHRARPDAVDLPQLVRLSLRIEADEEELVAGAVRVVLQVHDERDPLHVCDAALLFTGEPADHGFGDRARTHASIALRAAAEAWPPLDRLLALRVPDEITLESDELVTLLDGGVAALGERGVDVLWPRSLGRDLTASAVLDGAARTRAAKPGPFREEPLNQPLLSTEALFGFRWQLALHGDPLTEDEMDQLAAAASPVLRLRGAWTVVDPAVARKAKKRLIRRATAVQAVAAALTGVVEVEPGADEQTPVVVGATLLQVRDRLVGAATRDPVEPPAGLHAHLRDYQRQGLTWLAELTDLGLGACLADDMGLGKTVTLIALHLHRREAGHDGPTLVVCPASLLGNWEAEVRRFAPGVDVRRFHGSRRDLDGVAAGGGFVLTTYGTMRVAADDLAAVPWDLVVADEAQHVKNPASSTARRLRAIPSAARVALTGTPLENDLTELWAILDWTNPGLLGSRGAFRKAWAAPIESGQEPRKAAQFADLVGPFLLRRRKSDPGIAPELPPKTETDHPLTLTREQVVLYEAFVRDTMERIERSDVEARRGLVLAMLTGLKQICNHPAQFLKQSGAARLAGRSEKLDLLDELVATALAEGGSVLVFTQYVAMARLLEAHLDRTGTPQQLLHGGSSVPERERMVARFQDGEVPVFLLSLKAGGTGLNLTRADHVVHLDRWWNPAVEDQATDRAYRIGQTRPVQVHRMLMRGTVEEKVAVLLERKRALADAVLGRGDDGVGALTELSDRELRDLVEYRP